MYEKFILFKKKKSSLGIPFLQRTLLHFVERSFAEKTRTKTSREYKVEKVKLLERVRKRERKFLGHRDKKA